jgi:5-methylcytosine-specific restriction endonuclease McrA
MTRGLIGRPMVGDPASNGKRVSPCTDWSDNVYVRAREPTRHSYSAVSDDRSPIPHAVKRLVRQRCAFGCIVCGAPIYDYDHLVPWSQVRAHEPDNLVLLCPQHHREKTSGLLPVATVKKAAETPHNARATQSASHLLHYAGQECRAGVASNEWIWPLLNQGEFAAPLVVDDTPIILFRIEDEHLLLTVQLFDAGNRLVLQVLDNELRYSLALWDITMEGRQLTIRNAPGKIFVRITFEPPTRITIDRALVWRNGIEVSADSDELRIGGRTTISGSTGVGMRLGVVVGNAPSRGAMIHAPADREPFPLWLETERQVARLFSGPPWL